MKLRIGILLILLFNTALLNAAQYVAGDLAPRGNPDGQLNVADLLILTQIVNGLKIATPKEQIVGDVAPLNSADGVLDVRDMLVLQRAILGKITLPPLVTAPPAPILNPGLSPTSQNPYSITGTATPLSSISIYVNSTLQQEIISDINGDFRVNVILAVGLNNIVAIESDNEGSSSPSNNLSVDYQLNNGGEIGGDLSGSVLLSNTVYTVTSNITVSPGQVLTLEQGSRLEFATNTSLTVSGSIQVNGIPEIPVVFTSAVVNPSTFDDWSGIRIETGANNVVINYAVIENADIGLYFNKSGNVGTVTNSVIQNNQIGIYAFGGNSLAFNPTPVITGNSIFNNVTRNFDTSSYADGSNVILNTTRNWWGTSDVSLIAQEIRDYTDSFNNPFVDYSEYLDGPNGSPVIANWLFGHISVDTLLPSNTAYEVLGTIIIDSGTSLTVSSGVKLGFVKTLK